MKVFIFDYDGTITTEDTTDIILQLSSEDQIWRIEEEWKKGRIPSFQCMKAQARFLKGTRIEEIQEQLHQHTHVDEAFLKLTQFLKTERFYTVILSEGYDISIKFHEVQKHVEEMYASHVMTENGKLTGELQVLNEQRWDYNEECLGCCICKVNFLHQLCKQFNVTKSIAVGDGESDACLFRYVDVSFSLNPKYEATHQVKDLAEVYRLLRENNR